MSSASPSATSCLPDTEDDDDTLLSRDGSQTPGPSTTTPSQAPPSLSLSPSRGKLKRRKPSSRPGSPQTRPKTPDMPTPKRRKPQSRQSSPEPRPNTPDPPTTPKAPKSSRAPSTPDNQKPDISASPTNPSPRSMPPPSPSSSGLKGKEPATACPPSPVPSEASDGTSSLCRSPSHCSYEPSIPDEELNEEPAAPKCDSPISAEKRLEIDSVVRTWLPPVNPPPRRIEVDDNLQPDNRLQIDEGFCDEAGDQEQERLQTILIMEQMRAREEGQDEGDGTWFPTFGFICGCFFGLIFGSFFSCVFIGLG
ncbi:uncharacterized protein DNG_00793 [Cephalotrichum gorgonifer]|uniref:Uncharacterized protein n=1 Tax=Cephalotrichum gorgonifer TaxID=2041049 RepID=A0AAE8MRV7_9PEZI|nr:uncharacterized protein DNG_00793 [Cephalotrichum gorgonifer]